MREINASKRLIDRIETYHDLDQFEENNADQQQDDSSSEELQPIQKRIDPVKYRIAKEIYHNYTEDIATKDISGPRINPPPKDRAKGVVEDILLEFDTQDPMYLEKVKQRLEETASRTITLPVECMPMQMQQKQPIKQLPLPRRLHISAQDSFLVSNSKNEYFLEDITQKQLVAGHILKDNFIAEFYTPSWLKTKNKKAFQQFQSFQKEGKDIEDFCRTIHTSRVQNEDTIRITQARQRYPKVSRGGDIQPGMLMKLDQNIDKMNKTGNLIKGYDFNFK
ncbi:hypothetical protein SS50377_26688 [Spironucleus salmonicida]|uniref:Uncharacterized protein n=1 Tax=Spironucleus salmonicida TaxID=348837 RepID=V6LX24_9EUKA|nr:hypothetical protein SS50377_26688 [Spironucleus salmonicida]|eukprot:EST49162.1 hypothetical protein SS50377_10375 [Spironucleus salmonicida]